MLEQELTRRRLIGLGAGALAASALEPGGLALGSAPAPPRAVDFSLAVPAPLLSRRARVAAAGAGAGAGRSFETPPLRAPKRFDLVGLRWRGGSRPRVELRTRSRGARWSRWTEAPVCDGHGPDGSRPAAGTEPVWVGGADELQLRVSRRVAGLRLHFVNSTGTTTPMGRAREAVRRAVGVLSTRSVKGRTSGAPTIIPRSTWARDQLPPREAPRFGEVKLAFVHHTVGTNDYTPDQSASIVLAVGRYHRNVNGWDDIGYNFLVDKYGQIFEGRAGGVEAAVVGAQAQGYNTLSTGIANLGTYSTIPQTEAGLKALAALIAWKLSVHAVPVQGTVTVVSGGGSLNRYPAGARVELQRISGHRDGDASACPGDGLYAQLPQLRALAASMAGAVPAGVLTLAAGHTRLRYLGSTRVSGQLTLADGSQPAGALIELQVLKGGIYRTIGKTRTGPAGAWSSRVKRKRNTTLRARHVDAVGRPVVSPPLSLNVQPIVELDGGNVSVKAGALATFSGVVTPSKPNVVLIVERRGRGGAFKRTGRKVLRTRHGRFRTTLRFSRPGDYRVRAAVKADSQQIGARSAGRQVAVRKAGAGAGGPGTGGATSAASGAQVLPDLRVVR